ncbi:MAG: hypothetical protein Q8934_20030 [Bacillota bacterium]|nr:hypothetical protein [Bacillota bacterium]
MFLRNNNIFRTINQLKDICKRFENWDSDLQDLQVRLRTIVMHEPSSNELYELLLTIDNDLEEIIFTELERNHREYGLKAIQDFLNRLNDIKRDS